MKIVFVQRFWRAAKIRVNQDCSMIKGRIVTKRFRKDKGSIVTKRFRKDKAAR